MIRHLIPLLILSLLLGTTASLTAGERERNVLKAFFAVLDRQGPDRFAEFQLIGRLGGEIRNVQGTLRYQAPGRLRADFPTAAGPTALVLDFGEGVGFYQMPEAGMLVHFRARKTLPPLPPGGLQETIFQQLTAGAVDLIHENGRSALLRRAADGSILSRLDFGPGLTSIERYIQYDEESGDTRLALRFQGLRAGQAEAWDFIAPTGIRSLELPPDADNPFDALFPE